MILPKIFEKNNEKVIVSDNFLYCITIYRFCKGRAEMLEEIYYSTKEPIKINKKDLKKKTKDYNLFKFVDLVKAPQEYLLNNGFKRL